MSAAASSANTRNRFLDVDKEPLVYMPPLAGLTHQPMVSLEESVANMREHLHEINSMASNAIRRSSNPADNLTQDESAAIFLYTMESSSGHSNVYSELNKILRLENRIQLKPWFRYLKLIIGALLKLPSSPCTVWRAVNVDLSTKYVDAQEISWWGFSSCTTSISTLSGTLSQSGKRTLFSIECLTGKKIKCHSQYPNEEEVLIFPGTYFEVVSQFNISKDICIIHLREISRLDTKLQTFSAINGDGILLKKKVQWTTNGVTIAGGHGNGDAHNQLSLSSGIFVDEDGSVLVADYNNHRIVEWKPNMTRSCVVAGGNGSGNQSNQLNKPSDVIVDRERNSLLICDHGNRRVVRWPRQCGEELVMVIENIDCCGLTMDYRGDLYVTDQVKGEVRRYKLDGNYYDTKYTVVAGGHGKGAASNQLNEPTYLFVDQERAVYVSDKNNHRVMKWENGAEEGIIVAGGEGAGNSAGQLHNPRGLFVDLEGNVYVADSNNHRVMRCCTKSQETVIVGGNGIGQAANQLYTPIGLAVDRHYNLHVLDCRNHRVQRFSITAPIHKFPAEKWTPSADTVAGGHGNGHQDNQLHKCTGLCIESEGSIIVADFDNHRIIEWKRDAATGRVIAGGNGPGNQPNQLNKPSDVIVDREKKSLFICDSVNKRVVRWSRRQGQRGTLVIPNIDCWGLAMDKNGFLYVTDTEKHEVKRYELNEQYGIKSITLVAGEGGMGDHFNQLNYPTFVCVDEHFSVYVSDTNNHRVMKYMQRMKGTKHMKEGIVVAGGAGKGADRTQLSGPTGLFVPSSGTIYVVDSGNDRVMRWSHGMSDVIAGGHNVGKNKDQLYRPEGLASDRDENLYVADCLNHRVQRFSLAKAGT